MKDTGQSACALFVLACLRDVEPTVFDHEEWFSSVCSEASTSDGERGEE
jgi:hypothetical protein